MFIKQLSIFVENTPGRLADITDILAKANIDIRAMSVADTVDFGILRLIVDKPLEAVKALKEKGLTVSLTNVIGIGIDDKPGEFAKVMRLMADNAVQVEYMYAFISRTQGKAYVILRVNKDILASDIIIKNAVHMLTEEEIANL